MTPRRHRPPVLAALLLLGLALGDDPARAHHAPEEIIAEISRRIDRGDGSAVDHFARAGEYRILGRHAEAAADYRAALALLPSMSEAHRELARLAAALGETALAEAEDEARSAVRLAVPGRPRAVSWIVLAEILEAGGRPAEAVAACGEAVAEHPAGDVDWFLLRSRCQAQLGLAEERVRDLVSAQKRIPAAVLRVEWIDALMDAGDWRGALPEIERELSESRLRSAWLIRRARVFRATHRPDEAMRDLEAALMEIDSRLHPQRPDPGLLADRGVACALLGDGEGARAALDRLSSVHGDTGFRRRVKMALAEATGLDSR